jgi:hypothetical protein
MQADNEFLRDLSLMRVVWISARTVFSNLRLVLAIAAVFGLPADIIGQWITDALIARASREHLEIWRPLYDAFPAAFSLSFNIVGYAALAWSVGQIVEGQTPTVAGTFMRLAGRRLLRIVGTLAVVYGLILRPVIVVSVVALPIVLSTNSPIALALVTLALTVALLWCVTGEYIKYSFGEYPAVFEGIFYRAAAERSRFLVRGRRWWLLAVLFGIALLVYLLAEILTEVIPGLVGWPAPGLSTVMGVARVVYRSFFLNICLAFFFVFQTFLYFRLRREKHDLTFFDLSATDSIEPAGKLAEVAR